MWSLVSLCSFKNYAQRDLLKSSVPEQKTKLLAERTNCKDTFTKRNNRVEKEKVEGKKQMIGEGEDFYSISRCA